LPELAQVVDGLLRGPAGTECNAVRGHDVLAGATRGEWVRRDHLDAGLEEVVPRLELLRVAVAYDEHHDGARDHAVIRVLVPARRDEMLLHERGDVGLERERDDVRIESGRDGTAVLP